MPRLFLKDTTLQKLADAIEALCGKTVEELRTCYRGHGGKRQGYEKFTLKGDCLPIYRVKHSELLLVLTELAHDDLF